MSAAPDSSTPSPRLSPSAALFAAAIIIALLFASAFNNPAAGSKPPALTADCGTPGQAAKPADTGHAHTDHADQAAPAGPMYFAGGLWAGQIDMGAQAELGALAITAGQPVRCQSLRWVDGKLVVLDFSPILPDAQAQTPPQYAVLSIDHAGADPSVEFAKAAQAHVETFADAKGVVVIAPLPGKDLRPEDEAPYDWTFLWVLDNLELVDWMDFGPAYDREQSPQHNIDKLFATLQGKYAPDPDADQPDLADKTIDQLISALDDKDQSITVSAATELAQRSPYQAVPALDAWVAGSDAAQRSRRVALALLIRRAMGVHADALIAEAASSDAPLMRAAAARTIGDLHAVTSAAIHKLTLLAEDKDMRVRLEALQSAGRIGGRRAAGVAQLVEPYEMNDAMRMTYSGVMASLLAYGEPIQADSKVNRLRRMPINELLSVERDALVCRVLLERTDLPDDQVTPVLDKLASETGSGPLVALLNLLEAMNPATLAKREVLLEKLVSWKKNELNAQNPRLVELTKHPGLRELRSAAAGAIIRSSIPNGLIHEAIGLTPALFEGLSWLDADEIPDKQSAFTVETALTAPDEYLTSRIAALDALQYLPPAALKPKSISELLGIARESESVKLRFAAIRAINALPDALQPGDIGDLQLTSLTISAVPGAMKYDKTTLTAIAGRPVELTLINPDTMEHNLAITRPGRAQEVGITISSMNPAEAAAIGYIPTDSDAVLFHTAMVPAGGTDTLRFIAPAKPGTYDYVCTFPGHYTSMNGVLEVVEP